MVPEVSKLELWAEVSSLSCLKGADFSGAYSGGRGTVLQGQEHMLKHDSAMQAVL